LNYFADFIFLVESPKAPAKKTTPKKEVVVTTAPLKKDKKKKVPEKAPQPVEPPKPQTAWGSSTSRPKSLKEIQEEELRKVKPFFVTANLLLGNPTTTTETSSGSSSGCCPSNFTRQGLLFLGHSRR
jgi:hypothetical protein